MKNCAFCSKPMTRKRYNGALEDRGVFRRRRFCNRICGNSRKEVSKGTHHQRARKMVGIACEHCQTETSLHVHHRDGNPSNNDPQNLQTLCASCHLKMHWRERRKTLKPRKPCLHCDQPSRKLGMCQKHYQRFRKYGDVSLVKRGNGFGTWLENVS